MRITKVITGLLVVAVVALLVVLGFRVKTGTSGSPTGGCCAQGMCGVQKQK